MKTALHRLTLLGFGLALLLGALELMFRAQIIDFYRPELVAYNRSVELRAESGRPTALVFGNSFATEAWNFPGLLADRAPDWRVIDSAVLGTGTGQMRLIAPRRYAEFRPRVVILQLYVGQLFYDVRHASDPARTSFARALYWRISDGIRFLEFANHRLTILIGYGAPVDDLTEAARNVDVHPESDRLPLDPKTYNGRAIEIVRSAPRAVEGVIAVSPAAREGLDATLANIRRIFADCRPSSCHAHLLIIPDRAQAAADYLDEFRAIGGEIESSVALGPPDYPLVGYFSDSLRDAGNVTVVNPLAEFRAAEEQGCRLYMRNDDHLDPDGQHLLADILLPIFRGDSPLGAADGSTPNPCRAPAAAAKKD